MCCTYRLCSEISNTQNRETRARSLLLSSLTEDESYERHEAVLESDFLCNLEAEADTTKKMKTELLWFSAATA